MLQKNGKKVIDATKFHLFEFVHDVEEVPDVYLHRFSFSAKSTFSGASLFERIPGTGRRYVICSMF
jgi:hypothetical protein